jgi:hypothetical protein
MLVTAKDILDSDGKHPQRRLGATDKHRQNAAVLAERVNALFAELGITERPRINDGYRLLRGGGAARSAHLEGKAVDFSDPGNKLGLRITRALLLKHKLRREDTDYTSSWCHLDTREPHGTVFKP